MLVLSTLVCSCVGGGSWGQPSWSITATGSGHCLPEPPQGYQGPLTCDQEKVRYRQTDGQTDRRQSTTDWDKCIHFYLFISTLSYTCSVTELHERTRRQAPPNSTAPHHHYNTTMPAVGWNTHFGDHNISVDMSRTVYNSFGISTGECVNSP